MNTCTKKTTKIHTLAVATILTIAAASFTGEAQATYVGEVLADSPAGYWRFEETSGPTAFDSSGNGNNATYSNVSLGSTGAELIGGKAASFNGTTSAVDLPGTWGGSSALTIEAWVNVGATSGTFQAVVSSDATTFAHFQLNSTGSSGPYTDAGARFVTPHLQTPLSQWRHVVLVAESGDTRIYEDGVRIGANNTSSFSSITNSTNVDIGRGFAGGRLFNGLIDEVAIYETALSDERVLAHFLAATVAPPVPEPTSATLLVIGVVGLMVRSRRRRK